MIAAIDPGSEKTGTAILNEDGTLAEKKNCSDTYAAALFAAGV